MVFSLGNIFFSAEALSPPSGRAHLLRIHALVFFPGSRLSAARCAHAARLLRVATRSISQPTDGASIPVSKAARSATTTTKEAPANPVQHDMSAAATKKIAAAQRARWAKIKAQQKKAA
jgi:hypothetical protein